MLFQFFAAGRLRAYRVLAYRKARYLFQDKNGSVQHTIRECFYSVFKIFLFSHYNNQNLKLRVGAM